MRDGYTVDRWALTTEPGVVVPVLLFRPEQPAKDKPVVVYVGADRTSTTPGGPIERRVKAGETVALVEPRGMGETSPEVPASRRRGVFGADEKESFLALHLGRPLLGQRVFDLLQALRALEQTNGFHLIGIGSGGPIALHAAALDERIKEVEIEKSVVSWSAVVRGPISRDQLSGAVPGVLESYDLPDLAALLAPRPLTIRSAINPDGTPVAQAVSNLHTPPRWPHTVTATRSSGWCSARSRESHAE